MPEKQTKLSDEQEMLFQVDAFLFNDATMPWEQGFPSYSDLQEYENLAPEQNYQNIIDIIKQYQVVAHWFGQELKKRLDVTEEERYQWMKPQTFEQIQERYK